MVLVAVVALLALGAALVAGAFAAARGSVRATRATRAGIVAHASARRALARRLLTWSAADDSLGIGAFDVQTVRDSAGTPLDASDTRVRVQRMSASLYLVAADASVPRAVAPIARRRVRIVLERAPTIDSTVVSPLRPLARWASAELY